MTGLDVASSLVSSCNNPICMHYISLCPFITLRSSNRYDKAVNNDPKSTTAYHLRGMTYVKRGMHAEAIADFSTCIRLNPRSVAHFFNRALVHFHLQQYHAAAKDLTHALTLDPDAIDVRRSRALVMRRMGRFDQTHADYLAAEITESEQEKQDVVFY